MVTAVNEKTYDFRGLSTDTKPTEHVGNGSTFIEEDTGEVFIFDEANQTWILL